MSLAFLSKKSWHTTNVKNVEKVWIAEQKAEAEAKALAELQKQLTEERQLQELRQLQAQHGHVSKEVDNSLDWMYQGPSAQTQHRESAEEYLLGKVYSGKSSAAIKESLQPQVLAMPTAKSSWESKVLSKNDSFTRVHEDPLLLIKQQEKKTRESILSNPLKLAKLRQQVESTILSNVEVTDKKRKDHKESKKKDKKKEDKRDLSISRKDDHKSAHDSDRNRSDRSKREIDAVNDSSNRNYSPDKSRYSRESDDIRSRDRFRDDSRDRSRDRNTSRGSRLEVDELSARRGERRDSRERYTSRGNDSDKYHRSHSSNDSNYNSSKRKRNDSPERSRSPNTDDFDQRKREKISGYGLVKGGKSSQEQTSRDNTDNYLGPKIDLVKKKEEQEKAEMAAKRKQRERTALSEEERQARLRQMEEDARMTEEQRLRRTADSKQAAQEEDLNTKQRKPTEPKFLTSMRSQAYNTDDSSMKDRLQQNRHYSQRGEDLDSHGFMQR